MYVRADKIREGFEDCFVVISTHIHDIYVCLSVRLKVLITSKLLVIQTSTTSNRLN